MGDAIEFVGDVVAAAADALSDLAQDLLDAGLKLLEDVKEACEDVKDAIHAGLVAVQEAWDNLDPGLKQWLIIGVSFAVSFIPLVGPLIACVIDGTFTDMWDAIKRGDWGALALCAMAFVPGGKALKGLKAVEGVGAKRIFGSYGELKKILKGTDVQRHKLVEKRLIPALHKDVKVNDMRAVIVSPGEHLIYTKRWAAEIPRGTDYSTLTKGYIAEKAQRVYHDAPDLLDETLRWLGGL